MSIVSGTTGAVMGSKATKQAAETSAEATRQAAELQAKVQKEMFYRGLAEYEPFKQMGLQALPMYQSAIMGGPVQYNDPSYRLMSSDEIANHNKKLEELGQTQEWQQLASQPVPDISSISVDGFGFVPGTNMTAEQALAAMTSSAAAKQQLASSGGKPALLDTTGQYYIGPNGEVVQKPPQLTANYDYKASPTLAPQMKMYNRALASRGLSGSGQAASGTSDIAANDYYKQLSLLGGLVDVGRGVATSTAGAAQGLGNSLSSIYGNVGSANANAALMAGQAKAGLYAGLGAQSGNAISNAYQGYKIGQNAGWWGSGSGAAATEAAPAATEYAAYMA